MTKRIAFLFPGQGSQYVGMGSDLMDRLSSAKEIFSQVGEICHKPISKMCFEGPLEELTLTEHLQPAITAVNLACLAALTESGIRPTVSAGHSLGEYAALVSTGVVGNYEALQLVQKRGELMHRESLSHPGGMAAVIGLIINNVQDIVARAKENDVLAVANHNTAEQIVITGNNEAISRAIELVKNEGARAVPLKVSGAWHCEFMKRAVDDFRQFMEKIDFKRAQGAMLFNATAKGETDPQAIKDIMAKQLVSPVRWYDIVLTMLKDGIDTFVEVGPKKVLIGLVTKIVPPEKEVQFHSVENIESLEAFLQDI
jgi:[acyl-carrier-protein] S-malonyltransferase